MKTKKNERRCTPKETENRELRFAWLAFSAAVIVYMCIAWATKNTDTATVITAAASSLLGAGAYAVIEKYGDRLWEML